MRLEQEVRQQAQAPGLQPSDLMETSKDARHHSIPQQHHREAQQEGKHHRNGNGCQQ